MITLLHVWLSTGQIISGPIPASDCLTHLGLAQAAIASGDMPHYRPTIATSG